MELEEHVLRRQLQDLRLQDLLLGALGWLQEPLQPELGEGGGISEAPPSENVTL